MMLLFKLSHLLSSLQEFHNLIVFGLTNRLDVIDPALLRPGRFEVQLKIGYPNATGRIEIFQIHLQRMLERQLLSHDVSIQSLADITHGFSGAQIAAVVRDASSIALQRQQADIIRAAGTASSRILVSMQDFMDAMKSIRSTSQKRAANDIGESIPPSGLGRYQPGGFENVAAIDAVLLKMLRKVRIRLGNRKGPATYRFTSMLLFGRPGSGKTAVSVEIAKRLNADHVRVLSAAQLLEVAEASRAGMLQETFVAAQHSDGLSVLILDDVDRIVEAIVAGTQLQASRAVMHTLQVLLQEAKSGMSVENAAEDTELTPALSAARRFVVIATARRVQAVKGLGLIHHFDAAMTLPALDISDCRILLQQRGYAKHAQELLKFPELQICIRDAFDLMFAIDSISDEKSHQPTVDSLVSELGIWNSAANEEIEIPTTRQGQRTIEDAYF